ncbi:MAG: hypothetical protein N3A38_04620 [Planctomycetota bacterium]|nr:hypothetical protein [Planctomycetota bacterium]
MGSEGTSGGGKADGSGLAGGVPSAAGGAVGRRRQDAVPRSVAGFSGEAARPIVYGVPRSSGWKFAVVCLIAGLAAGAGLAWFYRPAISEGWLGAWPIGGRSGDGSCSSSSAGGTPPAAPGDGTGGAAVPVRPPADPRPAPDPRPAGHPASPSSKPERPPVPTPDRPKEPVRPIRPQPLPPDELAKRCRQSLDSALRFLAAAQRPDGSYFPRAYGGADDLPVRTTALALLAFLGDNHNERTGAWSGNVRRAVDFLISRQDGTGRLSPDNLDQAAAALALCEAARAGGLPSTRQAANAAVQALAASRISEAGWPSRSDLSGHVTDTVATNWCAFALAGARNAGLSIPAEAYAGIRAWLDAAQDLSGDVRDPEYAGGRVAASGRIGSVRKGDGTLLSTAAGAAMRMLTGAAQDAPSVIGPANLMLKSPPAWDGGKPGECVDYDLWFHATRLMAAMGGRHWNAWANALGPVLIAGQTSAPPNLAGSFPAVGRSAGMGRIAATALAAMCLESILQLPPGPPATPPAPPEDPDVF